MTPLLATKLYVPPVRPGFVPRPRLVERLDGGQGSGLVLVSAPAGFGKTTLLSEWLAARHPSTSGGEHFSSAAWLSLDADDNDLRRFLSYLTAALATQVPQAVEKAQGLLRLPEFPPAELVLTVLINGLCSVQAGVTLILDDYHTIEARPVHEAVTYLLDNVPPRLQLLLSTRADPPLPLSRWRSRGMMVEIRAADLRFTAEEAAAYLNVAMGLDLLPDDLRALNRRTEGWIVGLQMAALALQGKRLPGDASAFVRAFSGSHHYILDYLVEEVLADRSEELQSFLLQTSILSRMTGPLCDAVQFGAAELPRGSPGTPTVLGKGEVPLTPEGASGARGADGQSMLEALDAANLFLIPLDDERRWYRYHHLFADMLRARLQRAAGKEGIALLNRRAAQWFEDHGWIDQAFNHALAAEDFERAGRLIEENWLQMGHAGEMNTILRWLQTMPDEVVRARPMLCAAYAWVLWLTGRMDAVEAYLDAAGEIWEREAAQGSMDPSHARWQAGGPALRIQLARHRGQLAESIGFARQTLEMAFEDDALLHSYGYLGLAHAYRELGNYEESVTSYAEGIQLARAAGNLASASIASFYLARVLELQGRLQEAAEVLREALQFTEDRGLGGSPAPAILHFGMANLLCEWNDLPQAQHHMARGQELARLGGHHELVRNGAIVHSRLRLAQDDPAGALAAIHEAEEATAKAQMPLASAELAAYRARAWLAMGDLASATRWVERAAQRPGQDRGYTRQLEAMTVARVLLARGRREEALETLVACRRAAEESGGWGWRVEIGIFRALAHEAGGNWAEALAELEDALLHAEPEGYVQVFLSGGAPMLALLRRALARGVAPRYVARLLAALDAAGTPATLGVDPSASVLVEPLTEREREVLRLMAAGMSNREIAAALVLAMGTVKAHLHNIYGKLGVRSRGQAAARARDLDLD